MANIGIMVQLWLCSVRSLWIAGVMQIKPNLAAKFGLDLRNRPTMKFSCRMAPPCEYCKSTWSQIAWLIEIFQFILRQSLFRSQTRLSELEVSSLLQLAPKFVASDDWWTFMKYLVRRNLLWIVQFSWRICWALLLVLEDPLRENKSTFWIWKKEYR